MHSSNPEPVTAEQVDLLNEAISICEAAQPPLRAKLLTSIVPHLANALRAKAVALVTADADPVALAALAKIVRPEEQKGVLRGFVAGSDKVSRSKVLELLDVFMPLFDSVEGQRGVREVRRAVVDTARWFR